MRMIFSEDKQKTLSDSAEFAGYTKKERKRKRNLLTGNNDIFQKRRGTKPQILASITSNRSVIWSLTPNIPHARAFYFLVLLLQNSDPTQTEVLLFLFFWSNKIL